MRQVTSRPRQPCFQRSGSAHEEPHDERGGGQMRPHRNTKRHDVSDERRAGPRTIWKFAKVARNKPETTPGLRHQRARLHAALLPGHDLGHHGGASRPLAARAEAHFGLSDKRMNTQMLGAAAAPRRCAERVEPTSSSVKGAGAINAIRGSVRKGCNPINSPADEEQRGEDPAPQQHGPPGLGQETDHRGRAASNTQLGRRRG